MICFVFMRFRNFFASKMKRVINTDNVVDTESMANVTAQSEAEKKHRKKERIDVNAYQWANTTQFSISNTKKKNVRFFSVFLFFQLFYLSCTRFSFQCSRYVCSLFSAKKSYQIHKNITFWRPHQIDIHRIICWAINDVKCERARRHVCLLLFIYPVAKLKNVHSIWKIRSLCHFTIFSQFHNDLFFPRYVGRLRLYVDNNVQWKLTHKCIIIVIWNRL